MKTVNVIGAGLAGVEAAYQLLKNGISVNLYEMKPKKFSPAHKNKNFCELVCSNSLKSNDITTSGGLLKEELRNLDSIVIKFADKYSVPAGSALAVDRDVFSKEITDYIKSFKNLNIIEEEVTSIPNDYPTIIATGPLTSESLIEDIRKMLGQENFYFFDAIAPIVNYDTINFDIAFVQDRYNKGSGEGDYINLPFTKEQYDIFYQELINAKIVQLKDFENKKVFEGCMPIEVLAKRGYDSMRFGPLKPVGITDPKTNKTPYAVVQLRRETNCNDIYNIVGFQTNLTFDEQKRVFRLIPGLESVEFSRFGTMHKNTYINSPTCLNKYFQLKSNNNIFFAGQISGVEGYVESIASGLMVGINMVHFVNNIELIDFGSDTIIGNLSKYISTFNSSNFQPMSANMGLLNTTQLKIKDKKEKYTILAKRSIDEILNIKEKLKENNYEI